MTVPPNPVSDMLNSLAACLCAQIETDGEVATCFCGVIPGDAVIGEYAGDCDSACGMAWVRLISAYPATGVGVPDESANNCSSTLGFDVEIGILRCMEIPEDGQPLSLPAMAEQSRLQTADMMTLWRTILCCDAISTKDAILRGYQPMGPLGGLVGGSFTVQAVV